MFLWGGSDAVSCVEGYILAMILDGASKIGVGAHCFRLGGLVLFFF